MFTCQADKRRYLQIPHQVLQQEHFPKATKLPLIEPPYSLIKIVEVVVKYSDKGRKRKVGGKRGIRFGGTE